MIEAFACEYQKNVIPTYYELTLKSKYAKDELSSTMLDLIFNSRVTDLGDTFWYDNVRYVFTKMFQNKEPNIVAKVEAVKPEIDAVISSAVEFFKNKK